MQPNPSNPFLSVFTISHPHAPHLYFCLTANDSNLLMEEGMAFTIEPIVTEGSPEFKVLEDSWTVVSLDNQRSAQFEHTVLITSRGAQILTKLPYEA